MLDPANFFHTGIAVPALAPAMDEMSGRLGISWTRVHEFHFDVRIGDTVRPLSFRFAYSPVGPPYLELVEAVPETPWAADDGARLHHLGYWVDDLPAEVARLRRAGAVFEACDTGPDGDMNTFAFVQCAGVRFELVSSTRRASLLELISAMPDGD